MFFAVPVVGKVLANYAASDISDNISAAQKTAQARLQSSGAGSVDPAAFVTRWWSLAERTSARRATER